MIVSESSFVLSYDIGGSHISSGLSMKVLCV